LKTTFEFAGPQKGWTETYYSQPTGDQTILTALANAEQVALSRRLLLGDGLKIKAIRVQQVQDAAGNKIRFVGDTKRYDQGLPGAAQPAAAPDLCVLCDAFKSDFSKHKEIFLRGIWDAVSTNYGTYTPGNAPGWQNNFDSWAAKIVQFGYGWLSATPQPVQFTITNYVQDTDGFVDLTFSGAIFAAPFGRKGTIRVVGLPSVGGRSVLNGPLLVRTIDASHAITVNRIAVTPYAGTGTAYTYGDPLFIQIGGISAETIRTRETGAPLLESPGRQSARART
jgi:hypothetical protein